MLKLFIQGRAILTGLNVRSYLLSKVMQIKLRATMLAAQPSSDHAQNESFINIRKILILDKNITTRK